MFFALHLTHATIRRSLMCSRPVVSLAIAFCRSSVESSSGCFHTRRFACRQPVADVQQARHFFSPYLNSFLSLIAKIFFRSNSQWLKHSSGRFHTRLLVCKQPVAVVQQARRIFSHRLSQSSRILSQKNYKCILCKD